MPGPLEGIRVVEIGVWVAGPAAGCVLADWGADVIKIEPPGIGDPARTFSRMLGADLPSNPIFENDNRSKRSIALDLAADAGRGIAHELLARADVFVTNVRMAGLARLGLDPKSLLRAQPAPRLRRDQRLRLRGSRRRPRRLRHRRLLGALGHRRLAHQPRPTPALPARRNGRSQRGPRAGGRHLGRALPARAKRRGPARHDVAAARGPLHALVRPLGGGALRGRHPGRQPRHHGQPLHQQLQRLGGANGSGWSASRASATGRRSRARPVTRSGSRTRASRSPRSAPRTPAR